MPQCLHCKAEIETLIETGSRVVGYRERLSWSSDQGGLALEETEWEKTLEHQIAGYECPKCEALLFTRYEEAEAFLKPAETVSQSASSTDEP